jgi:peptidyl-prolyl cis-trans isomerase SurA
MNTAAHPYPSLIKVNVSKKLKLLALSIALGLVCTSVFAQSFTMPRVNANGKLSTQLRTLQPVNGIQSVDSIVAIVNTEIITRSELKQRVLNVTRQMNRQNIPLPPSAQLEKQVLERIIIDTAQLQLAKESAIRIDEAVLEKTIMRIADQNGLSITAFREKLEAEGMTLTRFRNEVRDEMLLARIREREVASRIQVSESEIDNFIAEQTGGGSANAGIELNIAQILIRTPENANSDVIEQARKKAEQLASDIRTGADFGKLAAANSAGPEALKGGEIGLRASERLPQLFVDAVQNINVGQITVVKSPNGFHILKLVEKKQGSNSSAPPVTQTRVRHILIRTSETVTPAEARRRIQVIKERLDNRPNDFADLARQYSGDGTAQKGGDLGWLYEGDTVPEFERAMNALAVGQMSNIVETQFGAHILQVLERKSEAPSLERQRQAARLILRERKADEAYQDWVRQLRDRTYVELRLDNS